MDNKELLLDLMEQNIDLVDYNIGEFLVKVRNGFTEEESYIYEEQSQLMADFLGDVFGTQSVEETAKAVLDELVNKEGYFKIADIDNFQKRLSACPSYFKPSDFDEAIFAEWYENFMDSGFDIISVPGQEWSHYGNVNLPSLYADDEKSLDLLKKINPNYYVAFSTHYPHRYPQLPMKKCGEHFAFRTWGFNDGQIEFGTHTKQIKTSDPIVYIPLSKIKPGYVLKSVEAISWLTKPIIDKYNLPVWEG